MTESSPVRFCPRSKELWVRLRSIGRMPSDGTFGVLDAMLTLAPHCRNVFDVCVMLEAISEHEVIMKPNRRLGSMTGEASVASMSEWLPLLFDAAHDAAGWRREFYSFTGDDHGFAARESRSQRIRDWCRREAIVDVLIDGDATTRSG